MRVELKNKSNIQSKTTFILGAGFSRHLGFPDTNGIAEKLLTFETKIKYKSYNPYIDETITSVIGTFLSDVFSAKTMLPSLEDVFTCVDLSCNRGLSLGKKYDASRLRAIRRMLIHRVLSVIQPKANGFTNRSFSGDRVRDAKTLVRNGSLRFDPSTTSFVVTNWDISLEMLLANSFQKSSASGGVDYGTNAIDRPLGINPVKLIKVHGSANWLYCSTCDSLAQNNPTDKCLYFLNNRIQSEASLFDDILERRLLKDVSSFKNPDGKSIRCGRCKSSMGPLIATHSYSKHLTPHPFRYSWERAKELLVESDHWTFVGYSLPTADFELRHLLKFSQHAKSSKKQIRVIVADCASAKRYIQFFGKSEISDLHVNGVSEYTKNT